ncbi:alpha/beta hydrolase [Ectobacillus sp. JY-23]|uniref:alpha/beta fold hydrolase n=1 Tax=Ectobacillus sp. JY-23 TaxID=2933872 RepID=UPI001FF42D3F|nr:alpha/beta hydrolase [Ectobacillus sp. JY-23]UOY93160.1 alpha/beta hydrolase [Ectobacillus sp. JY-23]
MGYYVTVETSNQTEHIVNIFVEDIGPRDGKVILFLHGWPVNHKMFEYQYNELPKHGYRCIGVDLRGFGKSDRPWSGYSYNRLADDIRSIVETLQLKAFVLVGFSMGGAIAVRYMARHSGHQVAKLALLGAAAPAFTQRPGYPYGLTKDAVDKLIEDTYQNRPSMLQSFGDIFFERYITEAFKSWFFQLGLEASGHGTIQCAVSLRDEDLRADLSAVHVPTVICHGIHDKICPFVLAEIMHAGIKNSHLIPFQESGHGLFYCEREKLNRELLRFADKK